MVFGFGHIITAWIAGKAYETIRKRKLSHPAWLLLLLGSILPDVDHLIDWTLNTQIHRSFTHSILFAVLMTLLAYLLLILLKEDASPAFAISLGIMTHLLMDGIFPPGLLLFWPSQLYISFTHIGYAAPAGIFESHLEYTLKLAILDMGLGVAWLFYLGLRKRIKF